MPVLVGGGDPEDPTAFHTAAWGDAAPSLPQGLALNLARAGVTPADPLGQWIIRTGVPSLGAAHKPPVDPNAARSVVSLLQDPNFLARTRKLPLATQTAIFKMSAPQVGGLNGDQLQRLMDTGSVSHHRSLFGAITGDITGAFKTGARDLFTVAQAPFEAATGAYREVASNRVLGAIGTLGGTEILRGLHRPITTKDEGLSLKDLGDQITLVQALKGKSLGDGYLPEGTAHEAAVKAQQASASLNGHALTPGRAFAAYVTEPGSRPYSILSGAVDAYVAIKGDPAAALLNELSDTAKAARLFAPTSEAARISTARHLLDAAQGSEAVTRLRQWSQVAEADEPNLVKAISTRLESEPGALQELTRDPSLKLKEKDILGAIGREHGGGFLGWRNAIHPPTMMEWLNKGSGRDYANWAADAGFYDIWRRSGKNLPVDVAAALGDAHTADEVRTIMGGEAQTLIRGIPEGVMPYAWKRPFQDLRLFQYLPRGSIDYEHLDNAVENTRLMLRDAKVEPVFYDILLGDMAKARNKTDVYNAYKQARQAVADTLTTRGVDRDLARKLTRIPGIDDNEELQARWIGELTDTPHISGLALGGETTPLAGPHLANELLNRALPMIDVKEIHRNVGIWGQVWQHPSPVVSGAAKSATYLADGLTGTMKVMSLLRGALAARFLGDEQGRMATSGLESLFKHPGSFIAHIVGHEWDADRLGVSWAEQAADGKSAYARAVGESAKYRNSIWDPDKQLAKEYVTKFRGSDDYHAGWLNEISHLSTDGPAREVARALSDVAYAPARITGTAGLDAVKEWGWSGAGKGFREDLARAHLWGGASDLLHSDRNAWDGYVDSVAERIRAASGDNPEIVDAIAHGKPFGFKKGNPVVDPDFTGLLHDLEAQGIGPEKIRTRVTIASRQKPRYVRNVVDTMFGALMDAPTKTLTRAPTFKQYYLQRFDELAPHIGTHGFDAVHADALAKDFALKKTRDLLYYPGERANVTEKLRNIAPFAEVWRNVMKTWVKLGAENPVVLRRGQQLVTEGRSSGFFHPDPRSGKEMFTLVPAGVMKHLTGVPFPMEAPVEGINVIGHGLPGVGPGVTIAADALLPKGNKVTDKLRDWMIPYGSPDFQTGFFESMFPGWADKIRMSGFLTRYLPGNPQLPFMTPTPNDKRVVGDLAKSVFTYHMSTGNYDLSDPKVLQDLTKQSTWEAQRLYLFRGLAQFASPAPPDNIPNAQSKDGAMIETWKLTKDWQLMEKSYGNLDDATAAFVNKYGPKLIFATEPMARRVTWGAPTTEEAQIWRHQHGDFAASYKNVYGYFAPQDGQFSYTAYLDSIARGDIAALSVDDWARLADARLGNAIYSQARQKVGVSPNPAQRDWLAQVRSAITEQYPGFNVDSLKVSRNTLDQNVVELRDAIEDPTVARTPTAQAARTYIQLRDKALQIARERTGLQTTTLSGAGMSDLRAWLYDNGGRIALKVPDFANIWQDMFLREVEPVDG